ncbi:hypothetical protein [Pseudoblastomonas halimionae]|uniref:Uncharacterized protein n=1 Tax=Alteriqipengyuania halimionae TaxID=1926630 RepID=A0A6I4U0W9_9SPHN|nr:hypothetical protein [Alteriqipengyuania halimionae]MXP08593.1 hypothetical protein [Alteriqipengyuania halimionae]
MRDEDKEIHIETDEVRGGQSSGVVRWVLLIGTLVAIVLLSIVWMTGAATSVDDEAVGDVSGQVDPTE